MVHSTLQTSTTSAFSKPLPSSKTSSGAKDLSLGDLRKPSSTSPPALLHGLLPARGDGGPLVVGLEDASSRCRSCSPCGSVDSGSSYGVGGERRGGSPAHPPCSPSPPRCPSAGTSPHGSPTVICTSPTAKAPSSSGTTSAKLSFSVDSIMASSDSSSGNHHTSRHHRTHSKTDSESSSTSSHSSSKENGLSESHHHSHHSHGSPSPPPLPPPPHHPPSAHLLAGHPHHLQAHPGVLPNGASFSVDGILGKLPGPSGLPEHLAGANPYLPVASHADAAKWSPGLTAGAFPSWLAASAAQGYAPPTRTYELSNIKRFKEFRNLCYRNYKIWSRFCSGN